MGLFAVAAAVTISNARAFDEIDRLRQHLESENAYLRDEVKTASDAELILWSSARMRRVLEQIEMVAPTDATVLVTGETAVGKKVVAASATTLSPLWPTAAAEFMDKAAPQSCSG